MSDIRNLLNKLDGLNESQRLDERQKWDALDAIADKYAKEGMSLEDLAAMEREAKAAEPEDLSDEEKQGFMGFLRSVGRGVQQAVSTEDFRVKYTLAIAAEKLNLPGLYTADGSRFCYYDEGDQNDANDAGFKSTSRSSREDAEAINNVGLLPPSIAERFNLEPNAEEPEGATTQAAPDNRNTSEPQPLDAEPTAQDGRLRLSDGSEFYRNAESQRALNQKLAGMVRRLNELLAKVNESAPASLRGYLSETDRTMLLKEALSSQEQAELRQIVNDLRAVADFTDDQGSLISDANLRLLRQKLDTVPQSAIAEPAAGGDSATGADEPEPEAAQASDASDDQDATVDPGEGSTSGSLEAFASSGKGGLANDPDEVDAIKELQQYLTDLGFDPNGVDGKYGRGTINAVKQFQEYFGAAVDGDAGPETIGKIVSLRNIRWGDGGSKNFIDWRNTMTRMEELIGKAGNATESTSMGSMSSILETLRRLDEALSDAEAEELQGIVDELQSAYDDAEFQAALPQRVQQRFANNMRSAQGVLGDRAPAEEPGAGDEPTAGPDDGTRGGGEAGEAAYKEVTGSGQSKRYTVFDAEGNELSTGRGNGPRLPTRSEWESQNAAGASDSEEPTAGPDDGTRGGDAGGTFNVQTAIDQLKDAPGLINDDEDAVAEVFRDQIKSKDNLNSLVQAYPEVFEDLHGFLNSREMQEYVGQYIEQYGVQVPPKGTAPDPNYVGGGSEEPEAQTTPTDSADAPGDIAANAGEPTTNNDEEPEAQTDAPEEPQGDTGSQGPEDDVAAGVAGGGVEAPRTVPQLQQMPVETPEDAEAFLRALPPEVIQSLPPEERAAVEQFTGTGQSNRPPQPVGRVSSSRPAGEPNPNVRPGDETNALDAMAADRLRNRDF